MESMLEYHPSSNHCLPRRRRRPRAYAGYAIGKGHITQGSTWWTVIRQQFGRSAKTAPYGEFATAVSVLSSRPMNGGG